MHKTESSLIPELVGQKWFVRTGHVCHTDALDDQSMYHTANHGEVADCRCCVFTQATVNLACEIPMSKAARVRVRMV